MKKNNPIEIRIERMKVEVRTVLLFMCVRRTERLGDWGTGRLGDWESSGVGD
jgi:hypothetical protein